MLLFSGGAVPAQEVQEYSGTEEKEGKGEEGCRVTRMREP
jgi:hypothetical protein